MAEFVKAEYKTINPFTGVPAGTRTKDSIISIPEVKTISQFTRASLADQAAWDITHNSDPNFERIIQSYKDPLFVDASLDYDEADESQFTQENDAKTEFASGKVQLQGPPPISNVYAHYHLNESSGTNVADSSGNGRNGTAQNIEDGDWVAGKLNNALLLDGVNEYVDCHDIANFERTQAFTIEAWIKTGAVAGTIVSRRQGAATYKGWIVNNVNGKIGFGLANSNVTSNRLLVRTIVATFNDNAWHHVVVTYDGSSLASGVTIYVDGSSQSLETVFDALTASITNIASCNLGAYNDGTDFFNGTLDEIVIYDKELTQAEVTLRYNSGAGREDFGGYDTTQGWYVRTNTNQINTSLWDSIRTIAMTETTPASTQIKYLVSVDGRTTWKRWTGSAWATEVLANIDTNGNSKAELEALDESDWDLLFVAGTFDIVSSLKTTDENATPELSQIDINYQLPGKIRCGAAEMQILVISATSTKIINISGGTLSNLRTQILL